MKSADHIHLPTVPLGTGNPHVADLVTGEVHRFGIAVCRICKKSFGYLVRQTIPPSGHSAGKVYWK